MLGGMGWIQWGGIAAGGALGAVSRVALQTLLAPVSLRFPWGTYGANVLGSFLIGFLASRWVSLPSHSTLRLFAMAGFLGGFTTFSSFSLENLQLWRSGRIVIAMAYLAASILMGIVAVGLGYWLGRSPSS